MRKDKICNDNKPGLGRVIPPTFHFVSIYFNQKGCSAEQAELFFSFYSDSSWTTPKGRKISNWKDAANAWIWNYQQQQRNRRKAKFRSDR